MTFSERIPTAQELEEYYVTNYSRDDYLSPVTVTRYREILNFLSDYRASNRLIDVGAGIGHFLRVAAECGWDTYGTEYTEKAIGLCLQTGARMHHGILDPSNYEPESFDVITSFEVIEHINDPVEEVGRFRKILRRGGVVYLTTPNFNSLTRRLIGDQWNVVTYPEHLAYWTQSTIDRLFQDAGFKLLWSASTGISPTRLSTSLGFNKEKFISKESTDERVRVQVENSHLLQAAKNTINRALTVTKLGDSIKALYQKV